MSTDTGTDCRSHSCNIPTNHHPSRACSLALHLGPAPGSQRSPHDLSPSHSHHSWSSCDLCSRLWLRPPHGRRCGHKRRLIPPCSQCSLTWRVFIVEIYQCIVPFPSTSLLFSTSGRGLYWLLAAYSLRITWEWTFQVVSTTVWTSLFIKSALQQASQNSHVLPELLLGRSGKSSHRWFI